MRFGMFPKALTSSKSSSACEGTLLKCPAAGERALSKFADCRLPFCLLNLLCPRPVHGIAQVLRATWSMKRPGRNGHDHLDRALLDLEELLQPLHYPRARRDARAPPPRPKTDAKAWQEAAPECSPALQRWQKLERGGLFHDHLAIHVAAHV